LQRAAEALRMSERKTRDYAETASEWFWEQDADLRFTWISQESPIVRPGDPSYIGQTRWERALADVDEAAWAGHKADLDARRPFRNFVYTHIGKDDRLHHVSISGTPVFDDAGGFTGYRGTGRDITATVEAADELRRARDQAETASRVKSEFLASMTHELRTPLNAIIGFSELIRDQPFGQVGAQYVDYARDIHASGHNLLAMINDVLDMSKIEAGRFDINEDAIDLGQKVRTCFAMLLPRAEEAQLRLLHDASLDGVTVYADRQAVRQVLLNVLSNAVKFTPPGGTVSVAAEIAQCGDLVLRVVDTGIGIDPAAQRRLFEPFQQADSSISRRFGGTGLGLSISRRLMVMHGGTLELDSAPGKGTTARICFPSTRVLGLPKPSVAPVAR
jgi:signal transduction histidine kinase